MPLTMRPLAEGESSLLPTASYFAAPKRSSPSEESLRMASLRDHAVLDTPPEKRFDRIVELAAAYFQAPIALISLVDDDRQWFKSCIGLAVAETPREWAFCDHTIRLGAHAVLVVPDALNDERFANNPLVVGPPFIRFYAGAVLTTDDGHNLGTLCVIDTASRPTPSDVDLKYLVTLANVVVDQLELSKALFILEEQQRLLKSAESMSGIGHWRFDQGTQIVTWSDEVFKIHGIPREEAVPPYEVIQQLYHEEDRETLAQAVLRAQETGQGYEFKLKIRRPDGAIRHTIAKAECTLDQSGKTLSIFGVFQDVTDQHIAAAALAASEQHYRLLADNVSDVIAVYDVDGTFRYLSPSIFQLLGYAPEELLGRSTFSLIHDDDRERVALEFKNAGRTGDGAAVEYRAATKEGDVKWLEAKPKFHHDDAGNIVEISDSVRDVTERRAREAALRQASLDAEAADKAKATFLANMSHEIRTPMNGVLGFAELLLASDLDRENRLQVKLIAESGRAMMRLLNDILDISKIESGQMQIAAEPVDLRHVLRSASKLMEPGARAKDVDISVRIDPSLPRYISGDQLRLRQIILNLIGNAIKFTERGWVELYAAAEDGIGGVSLLRIDVRDSGIGIEASQLDRIFKHFAQADDTIGRRFGGTGLGLPISAELARLMGGGISVESAPGQGATFTLRLPLCEATGEDQAATLHGEAAGACTGREHRPRVLVAEDHDINQTLITAMATRVGLDPVIARDGAEAVSMVIAAAAEHRPFAMVLMDIQMPRLDGIEATRQLRASGFDAKTLPIIALTANAYAEDIAACIKAGMQAHLSKPVRLRDLKHLANLLSAPLGPEIAAVQSSIPDEGLASRFALRQKQLLHHMAKVVNDGQLTADGFEALLQMLHQFAGTAGYFGQHAQGAAAAALEKALLKAGPQCAIPLLINARKALDAAASGLG
jgi:PAS domain S-box-containing protein